MTITSATSDKPLKSPSRRPLTLWPPGSPLNQPLWTPAWTRCGKRPPPCAQGWGQGGDTTRYSPEKSDSAARMPIHRCGQQKVCGVSRTRFPPCLPSGVAALMARMPCSRPSPTPPADAGLPSPTARSTSPAARRPAPADIGVPSPPSQPHSPRRRWYAVTHRPLYLTGRPPLSHQAYASLHVPQHPSFAQLRTASVA